MSITLTIPGYPAHLAVLRATVGSVAARAHLTIDQVEDVRLAVEEAAATLLTGSPETVQTTIDTAGPLTVVMTAVTTRAVVMDPEGFSWTILTAMTDEIGLDTEGDTVTLTMRFATLATTR